MAVDHVKELTSVFNVSLDDTSVTEWRDQGIVDEKLRSAVSLDDTSVTEWRLLEFQ